jgi:hypothetical protein
MFTARYRMSHDYCPSWGLVMSGGFNKAGSTHDTVECTTDGKSFMALPSMPEAKNTHCLKIVDDDKIIVAGGESPTDNTGGKHKQIVRRYMLMSK